MIKRFLILIYIVLIVFGCSPSSTNIRNEMILPADRLIKKMEINRRKVKVFEGTGILRINSPSLKATSNFEVVVKKPDSIRISFFGPFGVDIAHVLIQKREVELYDVLQNTLYTSSRDNDFLSKFFQIDISFEDLLNSLIGSVDLTEKLQKEPDEYSTDGKYKLVYIDKVRTEKTIFFVDFEKINLTKYFVEKFNGEKIFQADYSDFSEINKLYFPNKINLINLNSSQELFIEYRRMRLNNEKNLHLTFPQDVKIVKLD